MYSKGTPANAGGGKGRGTKEGMDDGTSESMGGQAEESIDSPGKPPLLAGQGKLIDGLISVLCIPLLSSDKVYEDRQGLGTPKR